MNKKVVSSVFVFSLFILLSVSFVSAGFWSDLFGFTGKVVANGDECNLNSDCSSGYCNLDSGAGIGICEIASAVLVEGVCGSSNGGSFSSTPTTNLCSAGSAGVVGESSVEYFWTCTDGESVSCSATKVEGSSEPILVCKNRRVKWDNGTAFLPFVPFCEGNILKYVGNAGWCEGSVVNLISVDCGDYAACIEGSYCRIRAVNPCVLNIGDRVSLSDQTWSLGPIRPRHNITLIDIDVTNKKITFADSLSVEEILETSLSENLQGGILLSLDSYAFSPDYNISYGSDWVRFEDPVCLEIKGVGPEPLNPKVGRSVRSTDLVDTTIEIPEDIVNSETEAEAFCVEMGGCYSDNRCFPIGYRRWNGGLTYCSEDNGFVEQRDSGGCFNHFECTSNICVDGVCFRESWIKRIRQIVRAYFGLDEGVEAMALVDGMECNSDIECNSGYCNQDTGAGIGVCEEVA